MEPMLYPSTHLFCVFVNAPFTSFCSCLPDVLEIVRSHLGRYLVDLPTVMVDCAEVRGHVSVVNQPVDISAILTDVLAQLLLLFEKNLYPYAIPEADAKSVIEASLLTLIAFQQVHEDRWVRNGRSSTGPASPSSAPP